MSSIRPSATAALLLLTVAGCRGAAPSGHTLNRKTFHDATLQDLQQAVEGTGWNVTSRADAKALGTKTVNATKNDLVAMISLMGPPSADYQGPRPSPPEKQEQAFRATGRAVYRDGDFVLSIEVHAKGAAEKRLDVEQQILGALR
jgi:hypothetical protein